MSYKNIAVSKKIHEMAVELVNNEKEQSPGMNYTLVQLASRLIMQEHKKVFNKNGKNKK